ncbi:ankyrin repeat domain-containing protein [Costertonia aggregata]|uniref:Ankyrin repeat domain-containing protein n=1 Tax=Costertonia aggregata TaxID=343403 RepID=A0A7H9AS79_9FLAO|nr:ankyrin repeat domain-containing protein [Costertonia aggregata]QLG46286.1 ankyrin repeat domain-containing protein [Costertonia aggregata]
MKTVQFILGIVTFFSFTLGNAQENVFLKRGYWKANPSISQIEQDIKAGNNVTALNESMFDAVCYALMEKADNTTIKYLLGKKGNEVDKLTHDGRTYIFWAAYRDNLEIMQYLVDKGAKANIEDSHGYSVMNFAAVTGQTNPELYDFLLENNADIKAKNHDGANALLLVAPFVKDYGTIAYFVSKGLDLKSTDDHGNGVFHYAAKGGHIPLLKTLVKKGLPYTTVNNKGQNALHMASLGTRNSQNSLETYKYLESLGINPDTSDIENRNPLHAIAYKTNDLEVFKYFINKGVDVDQQDKAGNSPFMNAAKSNTLEVVKFLSDHVEDIDAQNKSGHTALVMAVNRNSGEVVDFIIRKGADIHVKDVKDNTLAHYLLNTYKNAEPESFEQKLKLLTDKGLSLNETQENGNTLLHLAVKENNLSLLKRLEAFDIDINQKNKDGITPLHMAAMTSNNDIILKYLISQGADKSVKTEFEESVYDLANENELLRERQVTLEFLK